MRILLSNDDGIFAEGLTALKDILFTIGDIYIVAPDKEQSATGHGITVHSPLKPKEIFMEHVKAAWAVDGTPVDCVKLGLEALLPVKPDLLVSGINLGPNLGTDVLYSGTVSAAIEGLIHDIPSVAISLNTRNNPDYKQASNHIKQIIATIIKKGLPEECICNINIPEGIPQGYKVTSLGRRRYYNVFIKRNDPRGRPYFWMGGEPQDEVPDNLIDGFITDTQAVKDGYISITPVHFDLTDYKSLQKLNQYFGNEQ